MPSACLLTEIWYQIALNYLETQDVSTLSMTCRDIRSDVLPILYRTLVFKGFDAEHTQTFKECLSYLVYQIRRINALCEEKEKEGSLLRYVQRIAIRGYVDVPRVLVKPPDIPPLPEDTQTPTTWFTLVTLNCRSQIRKLRVEAYHALGRLIQGLAGVTELEFIEQRNFPLLLHKNATKPPGTTRQGLVSPSMMVFRVPPNTALDFIVPDMLSTYPIESHFAPLEKAYYDSVNSHYDFPITVMRFRGQDPFFVQPLSRLRTVRRLEVDIQNRRLLTPEKSSNLQLILESCEDLRELDVFQSPFDKELLPCLLSTFSKLEVFSGQTMFLKELSPKQTVRDLCIRGDTWVHVNPRLKDLQQHIRSHVQSLDVSMLHLPFDSWIEVANLFPNVVKLIVTRPDEASGAVTRPPQYVLPEVIGFLIPFQHLQELFLLNCHWDAHSLTITPDRFLASSGHPCLRSVYVDKAAKFSWCPGKGWICTRTPPRGGPDYSSEDLNRVELILNPPCDKPHVETVHRGVWPRLQKILADARRRFGCQSEDQTV